MLASDDAAQMTFRSENRVQMLASGAVRRAQRLLNIGERRVTRKDNDIRSHDFAHELNLQWIDRVLAAQVIATARDLLGQNRAFEREHREPVRDYGGDQ